MHGRGFSLIELLVAMVVIVVMAVGVVSATLTAYQTNRASERKARAVNLAHQVLECAMSQYKSGIAVSGAGCNPTQPSLGGFNITGPAGTPGTGAFTGMTQLSVIVRWNSPVPGSVTLDTYIDTL